MEDVEKNYTGKKSDLKKAKKAQGPSPFVFKPVEKEVFNQIESELLKSDIYQKQLKFEKKWKLKPGDKVINQVREERQEKRAMNKINKNMLKIMEKDEEDVMEEVKDIKKVIL